MKTAILILAVVAAAYGSSTFDFNEGDDCDDLGSLYPHVDCTKYYICDTSFSLVVQFCSGGTYFSVANQSCLYPREVPECVGGTRPPSSTLAPTTVELTSLAPNTTEPVSTLSPNTTLSTTEEPSTPEETSTTEEASTTEETSTTEEPTSLAPNTTLSTTTLSPNTTVPVSTLSPNTTVTTPVPTDSTSEDPSSPDGSSTTVGPSTTEVPSICNATGTYSIPYPGNCSLYYLCAQGVPTIRQCPAGLFFDPKTGVCNLADLVEECSEAFCGFDEISYKPVPGNCTIFLICVFGDVAPGFCPEGTLFDPEFFECNIAENVNCTSDSDSDIYWDEERFGVRLY